MMRRSFRLGRRMCFVFAAMSLAATALRADVIVRWSFNSDVTTTSGATITGHFDVDFKTSLNSYSVSNWDITFSGVGGDHFTSSNSTFTTDSLYSPYMALDGLGINDTSHGPYLILHTAGLTSSGGIVFLEAYRDYLWWGVNSPANPDYDPGVYNNGEGDNIPVLSGSLTGIPESGIPESVPEPATLLLLGSGLLSLAGLGGRRLFRKA